MQKKFLQWQSHCVNVCEAVLCPLDLGPPEKEQYFYKVRDNDKKIHHSLKGNARKNYRNATEDWENATVRHHSLFPGFLDKKLRE